MNSAAKNLNTQSEANDPLTNLLLSNTQSQALAQATEAFTAEQLLWSSGYLAGLSAAQSKGQHILGTGTAADSAATVEVLPGAQNSEQLTVLYGSQTGNGQALAEQLYRDLVAKNVPARLVNMADYSTRDLKKEQWLAIVVSTHGEGDAPDDAELLLEFLQSKRAPKLNQLSYFVLALGDSSYARFCQTGRDFDAQLETLGATRLSDRVECDLDYADPASQWSNATLSIAQQKIEIKASAPQGLASPLQVVESEPQYSADKPFNAEVYANQRITGALSSKAVHHLELSLEGSGINYQPGDALGVVTRNPSNIVNQLITLLGATGKETVTFQDEQFSLQQVLTDSLEITANSGAFLSKYAQLIDDTSLHARLDDETFRQQLINDYQIIDIVHDWPLTKNSTLRTLDEEQNDVAVSDAAETSKPSVLQRFIETLRTLQPRVYSISSSPSATPDEVHITVAEVNYEAFGRQHTGSASSTLVQQLNEGDLLPVFIEKNPRFRLPKDPAVDVIMIGPGTGVAPFRAFVEHRATTGASGRNWLFFGERNFDEDFLYQIEWQKHLQNDHLFRLDAAFSRDQEHKIYVQDRLVERGEDIWAWLEAGAQLYVCGDATHMAADVHNALLAIVAEHGEKSLEEAEHFLKTLKRAQRYQRDVY